LIINLCKWIAGLSPYNEYFGEEEEEEESKENDKKSKNDNESSTEVKYLPKTIKKISFEDYYKDWMNSATLVPKLNGIFIINNLNAIINLT